MEHEDIEGVGSHYTPLDDDDQDRDERPSANGRHPAPSERQFDAFPVRPLTIFLGVLWLLCMGYGLAQGDTVAIVIAVVFALFFGAPALIVFGFGRRSRRPVH